MWWKLATICSHQQHNSYKGNFSFHYVLSHVAEKQQAYPLILLAIYDILKFSYEDKTIPLRQTHTPLTLALK
jgi:hypothetical protein